MKKVVSIRTDFITLGQFLKFVGIIGNGAEAKSFLANNFFLVNDVQENRRGRKLYPNTVVKYKDQEYVISLEGK